ncbi:MAG: hypothetical protein K2N12_02335 [Helicobacter sp.]|nr:hypothetical protein [Helicobacter sp.]MDE7316555.1 hypothetical protein [Helicobacter sp.]
MKELNPKKETDEYFEKGQRESKKLLYNAAAQRLLIFIALFLLVLNLYSFVSYLIDYEVDAFVVVVMLAVIIFQNLFWLCVFRESCLFYFKRAVVNYFYNMFLGFAFVLSQKLLMEICPA